MRGTNRLGLGDPAYPAISQWNGCVFGCLFSAMPVPRLASSPRFVQNPGHLLTME